MTSFPLSRISLGTFARISATVGTAMVVAVPAPLEWAAMSTFVEAAGALDDPADGLAAPAAGADAAPAALTVSDEELVLLEPQAAAPMSRAAIPAVRPILRTMRGRVILMMLLG